MAKIKIKTKDIIPTLEELGIETEEFDNLERLIRTLTRLKNLGKTYRDKKNARKKIYAVENLANHIRNSIDALSECYCVDFPKHLYDHIDTAIVLPYHAVSMVNSLSSLESDPIADICAMLHRAEIDKLIKRIQKHMKKLAIKRIAESTAKREVDSSVADSDVEKQEDDSKESCTVTLAVGIRGIIDGTEQSNTFIDNGVVDAKVKKDSKGDFWFILDNHLGDKTVKHKFRITSPAVSTQQKEDKLVKANKLASFINHIQYLSSLELGVKYKQLEEEGLEDLVEYVRIEPVSDKDVFVESGLRLSIYVDILVDFEEETLYDCAAVIYNERELLANPGSSVFDHQLSDEIGFEKEYDEGKPFSTFEPFEIPKNPSKHRFRVALSR